MNRIIARIYASLLLIYPLICNYDVFGMNPTLLYCLIGFFLAVLWLLNGNKLKIDARGLPYLLYVLISAGVAIFNSIDNAPYTLVIKLLMYTLTVVVFYLFYWQIMDYRFAISLFISISIVATIIVVVQFALSKMGRGFCLVLPGIRVTGLQDVTTDEIRMNQLLAGRYSSFFFEPAHQAQYVLPCIALVLFGRKGKKTTNLLMAAFTSVGLFLTTSSIGILGTTALWAFYLFTLIKSRKTKKWAALLFLLPVLVAAVLFFFRQEDLTANLIKRLGAFNVFSDEDTDGFRRMKYGWLCFSRLNFPQQILGIGYKNFGYYLSRSGIGYSLMKTNDVNTLSYTNGITGMLIGIGLIGTLLNLRMFFFNALRSKDDCIFALMLVWGVIMFSSNAFDDLGNINVMVLIMSLMYREGRGRIRHGVTLCINSLKSRNDN